MLIQQYYQRFKFQYPYLELLMMECILSAFFLCTYCSRGHFLPLTWSKARKLTAFKGAETASCSQAIFILPEISKLSAEIKSGSLAMLLVSCVDLTNRQEIDLTKDHVFSSSSNVGGYCLLGQIPMDLLHFERSRNLSLGERAEMMSSVSMRSCYMKLSGLDDEKRVSFQFPHNSEPVLQRYVPVIQRLDVASFAKIMIKTGKVLTRQRGVIVLR